ncbi:ribonuclease H-like domain-containing protein [Tanacetum coccineum]|uniref:Ribonuclease H-like domain-containing protein n=1 Tax=Tanacetum coccineum TaxID=301880 RepID=A0ABQ4XYN2_9ASTR
MVLILSFGKMLGAKKLINGTWRAVWDWRINPRGRALDDLTNLSSIIGDLSLSPGTNDKWLWSCDATGVSQNRGVALSSILCPLCEDEVESVAHCLISCSWVKPLWRKVWSWWQFDPSSSMPSVSDFVRGNIRSLGNPVLKKIVHGVLLCVLWAIWRWRNNVCPPSMTATESVDSESEGLCALGLQIVLILALWKLIEGSWRAVWDWRINPRGRALDDLTNLFLIIGDLSLSPGTNDKWLWSCDATGVFKVRSITSLIQNKLLEYCKVDNYLLWNSWIPRKVNICVWRASLNRLPSRLNLQNIGVALSSILCPLCEDEVESVAHCLISLPPEEPGKAVAGEASAKKKGRTVAITTEDMQKRRNDVKARTTLLLALPDEHQLRFSKYDNAKELWEAILKTFGGNEATKKTKKN